MMSGSAGVQAPCSTTESRRVTVDDASTTRSPGPALPQTPANAGTEPTPPPRKLAAKCRLEESATLTPAPPSLETVHCPPCPPAPPRAIAPCSTTLEADTAIPAPPTDAGLPLTKQSAEAVAPAPPRTWQPVKSTDEHALTVAPGGPSGAQPLKPADSCAGLVIEQVSNHTLPAQELTHSAECAGQDAAAPLNAKPRTVVCCPAGTFWTVSPWKPTPAPSATSVSPLPSRTRSVPGSDALRLTSRMSPGAAASMAACADGPEGRSTTMTPAWTGAARTRARARETIGFGDMAALRVARPA